MKSIDSVGEELKAGEIFSIEEEPENEEVTSPGFLLVVYFFFIVYAMTARPVVYAMIYDWVSQLFAIEHLLNM